jgi:hypothetical protein
MGSNQVCDSRFPTAVDALESDEETVHFGVPPVHSWSHEILSLRKVVTDQ